MPRYVAFLRGVSPMNARMSDLRRCFEEEGFADVRTILSSGNVAFTARKATEAALAQKAEKAMQAGLGRSFRTIVRSSLALQQLIGEDPFVEFDLPAAAKRVVTFLPRPVELDRAFPIERDGARILKIIGADVFTAYEPSPKGPVFMALIDRTFGSENTTRTLDTVRRCARA